MKYVSDIKVNGKSVDYAIWPCVSNMVVTTQNMDTGVSEEVSDFPIDDCYGFSSKQRGDNYFIVHHTARAAQLYKYIKWVKTYSGIPARSSDVDFYFLGSHANFDKPQNAAARALEIDCYIKKIEFCEPFGSVVGMRCEDHFKCSSLYDFLIWLCGSTDLNIMSYGAVLFCNRHYNYNNAEIIFDHGAEADRFFIKMYLEALGGS